MTSMRVTAAYLIALHAIIMVLAFTVIALVAINSEYYKTGVCRDNLQPLTPKTQDRFPAFSNKHSIWDESLWEQMK